MDFTTSLDFGGAGLPSQPDSSYIPGLPSQAPDAGLPPIVSPAQHGFWNTVKSAVSTVYDETKGVVKTVYGDAEGAVSTVATDIETPIANAAKTSYWYLIGAVVVLGGVIYYAGKSGALKLNVAA